MPSVAASVLPTQTAIETALPSEVKRVGRECDY